MSNKLALAPSSTEPWYREGLPFECTGCGGCCTGAPGYAWVSEAEMLEIANYLKLSLSEFTMRYLRRIGQRFALLETRPHYDCIFLQQRRCTIYPVRPIQCRTFPFWPENLVSEEAWERTGRQCEGISPTAPKIPLESIQRQLEQQIAAEAAQNL